VHVKHIITTIERGGAENQLLLLASEQVRLGHKVEVYPLKGRLDLRKDFEQFGVIVNLCLWDQSFLDSILKLRKITKILPDREIVFHAHLPQAELLCSLSLPRSSIFIITRHFGGQFFPRRAKIVSLFLSRIASSHARKIICISKAVEENVKNGAEVKDPSKLEVIYYGFSNRILAAPPEKIAPVPRPGVIGTVARLSPEKDLKTLILAFAKLKILQPHAKLEIAGEGPDESKLKQLVFSLHLEDSIRWHGKIEDVYSFMRSLSLFVLPSKFEGFGMVLLEAMFARCRIVGARNSAIVEVLGDRGAGTYFETSDPEDLCDKILESLQEKRNDYIKNQEMQLASFRIERTAELTDRIYESYL
jgi:glycosyltransferase involved in cell wall biosynthesis